MEKMMDRLERFKLPIIVALVVMLSLPALGGLYYSLTRPVPPARDVTCVVVSKTIRHSSTLSRQHGTTPSSAPYVVCRDVETDELIQCEVHPDVYEWLSAGDTCLLRYSMGAYMYKGRL